MLDSDVVNVSSSGELIAHINGLLTRSVTVDAAWPAILETLQTAIPCQSMSLWALEPEQRTLTCVQAVGAAADIVATLRVSLGNTIPGDALSQRTTRCIADIRAANLDARLLEDHLKIDITAALCVPLQIGRTLCGELVLVDETVGWFSENETELAETVRVLLALALQTAAAQHLAQQRMAEREHAEEALRASQHYAANIIDSSLDMIIAVDNERRIIEFNQAAQKTFGYTPDDVLGQHIGILYADAENTLPVYQHTLGEGEFFGEIRNKRKNGTVFPCLLSASILRDTHNTPIGLMGISRDITERKRAEQIRDALYRISEAAHTTRHLDDLYSALREIIGRLMPVGNFYIALYDAETETISYPYYVDRNQALKRSPRPSGSGLADYVLRTGEPLLLTPEIRAEMVARGDMKPLAFNPTLIDWLGVPLKADGRVTGIITVQSHSETTRLGDEEKQILMFVSSQIATAIARKQAEEESHKLRQAIETTEVGVTITDPQGRIAYVNPADAAMHGYSAAELLGQPANLFTLPHLRDQENRGQPEALRHWKRERVNVRKDGTIFPVKLISNPIQALTGEHIGDVTICQDITERKNAEKRLRESEQRYRSIVENATIGIFQATADGRFITANPALARMLGYGSARELVETVTNLAEHLYVEPNHWREITEMIGVTQEAAIVETRLRHRDGGDIIAQLNIWAVPRDASAPTSPDAGPAEQPRWYFEGFVENITERKQMEKTLFRHATLLRSVAGAMTGLLVNPDFPTAMTQALELLGFATEVDRIALYEHDIDSNTQTARLIPRFAWEKGVNPEHAEHSTVEAIACQPHFARWQTALQANRPISGMVRNFPPAEREILDAQHIRSLILVPVTTRNRWWGAIGFHDCQTERQWREEEESILLALAASIGGAIARTQAETELMTANVDLTGALEDLQRAQTQLIHTEKMAALGQLVAGVAHEINTPLAAIRSAIGDIASTMRRTFDILPGFLLELSPECRQALLALVARGDGKNPHLLPREERALRADVTNRLRSLKVKHAGKIGEMLTNIGVYDQLEEFLPIFQSPEYYAILEMAYRLSGLRESTQTIATSIARASKVVFALKTYAHYDQSGDKVASDLAEGLETVLTLYQNKLKHHVEVVRAYAELPQVPCYPDELNQVWINLIHNALQAMDYRGALTLRTEIRDNQAVVSITDTGPGIPDNVRDRIFEPFFTTKPRGEGSGLGLDIVRKIVAKHQGRIDVQSRPGQTTFSVALPLRA